MTSAGSGSKTPDGGRRVPGGAREVASRVLQRVEEDGAFAAAALEAEFSRAGELDARDRGLATEIVYGVLRTERALLSRLAALAPRGLPEDPAVISRLLVAAYQLLLLDRVPAHAVVDAAVSGVRVARGPRVAGFANAMLRRVASGAKLDPSRAIVESAPPWLLQALASAVGEEEARCLFGVGTDAEPPTTSVRVTAGIALPAWLAAFPQGRASPLCRRVPRSGDLRRREGHAEGAFTLQEEGAQVVALAVGARPGDSVLDACAGRGQKTSLLRERIGADARLWATDLYPEKLAAIAAEHGRLGLAPPETAAVDWTVGPGGVPGGFDRVLVDAPCTGTGTLRHRPEIARRLEPGDPARLGALGEAVLRGAAARAKAGGRVVHAVCSVLPEECEAVVDRVKDVLEPAPFDAPEVAHLHDPGATAFRLLPGKHGTDGFFVASFVRRG